MKEQYFTSPNLFFSFCELNQAHPLTRDILALLKVQIWLFFYTFQSRTHTYSLGLDRGRVNPGPGTVRSCLISLRLFLYLKTGDKPHTLWCYMMIR